MKYANCPACGGKIHFDIGLQKVKCEYCESVFDPKELSETAGAVEKAMSVKEAAYYNSAYENVENPKEEVTVFSCPSCGAQVTGEDVSAVEYCQYCGSFVTFNSRIEKIRRPDYIAPFEITREKCEEIYRDRIKGTLYVPKELKDGKGIIEFHPMFIPFWNMEVEYPGDNKIGADEAWRDGNYSCKRSYDIKFNADGNFSNCLFDASKALDDHISECIGDYEPEKLVDYNPSYMHGAYADIADMKAEVYYEEAKERCFSRLTDNLKNSLAFGEEGIKFHRVEEITISRDIERKEMNAKVSSRLSMFPVWFMTFKNKDRVAYSVVNGQTGSIFTETPVDLVKFFLFSVILSVPIFLGLEFFATFRPTTMLGIVSVMTAVVLIMYTVIAGGEWDRDHRVSGSNLKMKTEIKNATDAENTKKEKKTKKKSALLSKLLKIILWILYIPGMILIGLLGTGMFALLTVGGFRIVALIVALIVISIKYKKFDKPARAMLIRDTLWGIIAILITVVFVFYDPVFDWYYYAAAIIAMIGMLISIGLVVKRYNRRVTHPLPHFFNGEEGSIS